MSAAASIDPDEAAFFGKLAADWWNPKGTSAMLHRITPVRVAHIRGLALAHFRLDAKSRRPLAGLAALDVGCGAGLMAEPLARMGAATSAIDAAPENIAAARAHAEAGGLAIDYQCIAVEDLAAQAKQFDLITCLEVVEHVAGRDAFFAALAGLLKPGGLAVFSTPNRTPASWAVVIAGAEHITRSIPRGAHDWNRFFTPDELAEALTNAGLTPAEPAGLSWRPGKGFHIGSDLSVNYFLAATKA
ncbi:bifunctional 2-polyprenyl-6-hydroxyphenol methylase/3-demethylubiquinol 3-O-methyltransferase UbiG [Sandarakinorhabdus oryzae]|uniref:bifunctional 2-polyprenyl-6-hydroxyphenol methylase/3-demethylubiquinol 3-O-methyltransferase UbiG n=1 Tax=Sandarakinorhabdus oryzae TaxID=2675220 RepID=UPI0012E18D8F|nr:bifunctional 2-polyprenyl-6-hydroxyphenol methylase/3-demethylubiquinol 3-O-methyltransferase UbiG [Sandarakinorhabdus oryzae]